MLLNVQYVIDNEYEYENSYENDIKSLNFEIGILKLFEHILWVY